MADESENTDSRPPLEVPEWMATEAAALAEVFAALRLPLAEATVLQRLLSDERLPLAWAEVGRETGNSTKNGSRRHPLTLKDGSLLRRLDNQLPANVIAMLKQIGSKPEGELRAGLFLSLLVSATYIAATPTKAQFVPELRGWLATMEKVRTSARDMEAAGFPEEANSICSKTNDSYVEYKANRPELGQPMFHDAKDRKTELVLRLAMLTKGFLSGRTLYGSVAIIASAALGQTMGKTTVQSIVRRHFEVRQRKAAVSLEAQLSELADLVLLALPPPELRPYANF